MNEIAMLGGAIFTSPLILGGLLLGLLCRRYTKRPNSFKIISWTFSAPPIAFLLALFTHIWILPVLGFIVLGFGGLYIFITIIGQFYVNNFCAIEAKPDPSRDVFEK